MSRLADYRAALHAAHAEVPRAELVAVLDAQPATFVTFIVDHGLGPLWHLRTGRDAFHPARMQAEALFLAQQAALAGITAALDAAGIAHVVIKGAANRLLCYEHPAARTCLDLDLLVHRDDRVPAARTLARLGFAAMPDAEGISRALVLRRADADVDLHWGLLREGRLGTDPTGDVLARRRRVQGLWMPAGDDTLFVLLVHPAFAKHLSGWNLGMHRVADLLLWLRSQPFDAAAVTAMLDANGVRTAAWTTLRWAELLAGAHAPAPLAALMGGLEPGQPRRAWLDAWLRHDLPRRTAPARWLRLLLFSQFLHDTPRDALRAARGRQSAARRSQADLDAFGDLFAGRAVGE